MLLLGSLYLIFLDKVTLGVFLFGDTQNCLASVQDAPFTFSAKFNLSLMYNHLCCIILMLSFSFVRNPLTICF